MNLFMDTSALVKLYHQEKGTETLLNFLNQFSGNLVLSISDLAKIEFHSAILKRTRAKEIKIETAKQVLFDFDHDLRLLNIIEINRPIKDRAVQLLDEFASTMNLRTLDSLQLASAILSVDNFLIDYFVASDTRLLDLAKNYFSTFNPTESNES